MRWKHHLAWMLVSGVAVLALGLEITRMRTTRVGSQDHLLILNNRIQAMHTEVLRLESNTVLFARALAVQSNRTAVAEARCDEERNTHEPLRRQVEKLTAEAFTLHAASARQGTTARDLQSALLSASNRIQALESQVRSLESQKADQQARLHSMSEAETRIRTDLAAAQQKAAESDQRLREAAARLQAATNEMATLQATHAGLRAEIEKLRAVPPPPAPPATQAPPPIRPASP